MKKLTKFLGAMSLVLCLVAVPKAKAWGTTTHDSLMSKGLALVKVARPEIRNFYTINIDMERLHQGVTDPDWEETALGSHYYVVPKISRENKGQYYGSPLFHKVGSGTARTRLENHYKKAIELYKKGDSKQASLYLGRACHYLQDICCPPHASGIQYPLIGRNYHADYEAYCDNLSYSSKYEENIMDEREIEGLSTNWGLVINNYAKIAASYKKAVLSGNKNEWEASFKDTFKLSQRQTAALLINFYQDIQKEENMKQSAKALTKEDLDKTLLYMFMMSNKTSDEKEIKKSLVSLFTQNEQEIDDGYLDPTLQDMFLAMNKK